MTGNGRRRLGGGLALVAAVALAMTMAAPSAQADHLRSWSGTLVGGIAGGAIGSAIGKGRGRLVAVGTGALLGGLLGRHLARDHLRPHAAHHRHWRAHRRPWHEPRAHHHHHQVWHEPPVYHPPAPPPRPWVLHRRPARATGAADYLLAGAGNTEPHGYRPTFTECRTLEGGLAPVYACRSERGDWRILR